MIRRSYSLGAVALGVSGVLHLGGLSFMPSQAVLIEGGAQQQEVRLGNSFQDVAEGVQTALEAEEAVAAVEAEPEDILETVEPKTEVETEPPEALEREAPRVTNQAEPSMTPPVDPIERVEAAPRAEPLKPIETPAETVQPETIAALAPLEALPTPVPISPVALPSPRAETIEAVPDAESDVPQVSRRPALRPKAVEEVAAKAQPKPKKAAKAQKKKPKSQPKKTAKKSTKPKAKKGQKAPAQSRGKASGTKTGKASQKSSGTSKSRKAGNAKASNYPGLVARKIRRSRKPRVKGRGRVVVRFRVSSAGGIASIGVAKSSGNASVDKAAVQYIRRAAPFPRPPQGAQRSFNQTVSFK